MILSINVPQNSIIPPEINTFTDNENLIMILVGIKAVNTIKYNNSSEEMIKIRKEYDIILESKNNEIQIMKKVFDESIVEDRNNNESNMKCNLALEKKQLYSNYNDIIQKYNTDCNEYRETIVDLNKNILDAKNELYLIQKEVKYNNEINELRIQNEINSKVKQKEDLFKTEIENTREILFSKEKEYIHKQNDFRETENNKIVSLQNEIIEIRTLLFNSLVDREKDKNTYLLDTIATNTKSIKDINSVVENLQLQSNTNTNKSNVRGSLGENYFLNLALNTFCDCSNFEIVDKAKTPHSGDFWLKFDKFTIMVDSKNYVDTPVPSRDRQKLKNDIQSNQHIKIAWLVSMDQPILTFSNYPFMIDIDDGVCYCYINSLMKSENPANLLRMAWYASNFVHEHLLNVDSEINQLGKYQKNELRIRGILSKMLLQSKERFATLNQLTENFKIADSDIRDCLNEEIRDVRTLHVDIIEKWWLLNTIQFDGNKIKSNDIHKKFLSNEDNRKYGIDGDMFKQILRSISIFSENQIIRGKTDKAQYIIVGYKFIV